MDIFSDKSDELVYVSVSLTTSLKYFLYRSRYPKIQYRSSLSKLFLTCLIETICVSSTSTAIFSLLSLIISVSCYSHIIFVSYLLVIIYTVLSSSINSLTRSLTFIYRLSIFIIFNIIEIETFRQSKIVLLYTDTPFLQFLS